METVIENSENMADGQEIVLQQLNNSNVAIPTPWIIGHRAILLHVTIDRRRKPMLMRFMSQRVRPYRRNIRRRFHSYSMDLNTSKQLQARLFLMIMRMDMYTIVYRFRIAKYYQTTDAAKLKGCETVTISVTVVMVVTLGSGTTSYKCSSCSGSLNNHSKDCAMVQPSQKVILIHRTRCNGTGSKVLSTSRLE